MKIIGKHEKQSRVPSIPQTMLKISKLQNQHPVLHPISVSRVFSFRRGIRFRGLSRTGDLQFLDKCVGVNRQSLTGLH
jgi:hypothetical protein